MSVKFVDTVREHLEIKRSNALKMSHIKLYALKYAPLILFLCLPLNFFLKLVICALWWILITVFFDHRVITDFSPTIRIWFGVPGAGKTSMAAYLTRSSRRLGYRVLSNVEIKGAYRLEPNDLGRYDMSFDGEGCHVIYDEGSIDFDNRNFKLFAQSDKPLYFALHRHMNNRVDVFSQGYDIDKRIRDRAGSGGLFHLRRIPLRGFVCYRRIRKILFIKKDDKQMIDGFEFTGLPRIAFTRPVWDSFDTLDMSLCPTEQKEWMKW